MTIVLCTNCAVAESSNYLDDWTDRADGLLKNIVEPSGLVSYSRVQKRRADLDTLLTQLGQHWSLEDDDQKLALYLNAYNLSVIRSVLKHWPLASVRDVDGFFDTVKHRINGRLLTLNDLENKVVRLMGRPRIHAALVCGAVSCPPLRRGAFTAEGLDDQLERITRRWINDTQKNRAKDGSLWLSAIFKWYGNDFNADPFDGVADFVRQHANEGTPIAELLDVTSSPAIRFLAYDWKLNVAPEN